MKTIKEAFFYRDGTCEIRERKVDETEIAEETLPSDPQADTDAMMVDHEYRLTLLELGITEEV